MQSDKYMKVSADLVEQERSTCGFRQRLLRKDDGAPASVTRLRTYDAKPHWHRHTHEYYYILQGEGRIVVDGEEVNVKAGDIVWIKPGHLHHAEGELESLIIGAPAFDANDMHFGTPEC